jgi:hypothetical protein
MFSIALRHDEHTRKYRVTASPSSGWELTQNPPASSITTTGTASSAHS